MGVMKSLFSGKQMSEAFICSAFLALSGGFPDGYALLWQTAETWILFRISSRGFRIGPFWKGHDPLHRWSCGRFPVR